MVISAGVVVVRGEPEEWKFLFLRSYRNWDFPKGELEPGEDALQAAQREVLEETGISDLRFNRGDGHKESEPYLISAYCRSPRLASCRRKIPETTGALSASLARRVFPEAWGFSS